MTTLQAGHLRCHGLITGRGKIFISSPNCTDQLQGPASLLCNMHHGHCPEVKQLGFYGNNTDYLVTRLNVWSCTPLPLHLHDAHRDNFTCTFYLTHQIAGSNPAEAVGFFRRPENPQYAFLRRGSKRICPMSQLCSM